jgi:hypothetical protein
VPETSFLLSIFIYANSLCVIESVSLRLLGCGSGLSSMRDCVCNSNLSSMSVIQSPKVLLILIEVVGMDVVVATKMIIELEQ